MLRKEEIEKRIRKLQEDAESLGLTITEFKVKDPKTIVELEKMTITSVLRIRRKPVFLSQKNYKRLILKPGEIGSIYGIKVMEQNG